MRLKKNSLIAGALGLALAGCATADARFDDPGYDRYDDGRYGEGTSYSDTARVTRVDPLYQTVSVPERRRQCWDEPVRSGGRLGGENLAGTLIGGVVGGVVGNRFGSGSGRDAMTVAGTIAGAVVGAELSQRRNPGYAYPAVEERCEWVTDYRDEERIDGYRVYYRYEGREFVTTLPYDPGRQLRVRVNVEPEG
jgi:uncharacterized protein YcfJ